MKARVGGEGEIVVPRTIRDQLGLRAGDEIEVSLRNGREIVLEPVGRTPALAGRFAGSGMAGRLLTDRASERR